MAEEGGGDTKRHTITGDFGVHLGLMDQLTLGENEGEFGEKLVQEIDKIAENKNVSCLLTPPPSPFFCFGSDRARLLWY